MTEELQRLRQIAAENIRYERQLARLRDANKQTSCIETAVSQAIENIIGGKANSFVIYGEPQSGKTEMMICLTAKLIDTGFNVVVHLLNDSVQLLQQNLDRFQRSNLSPSARNFSEIIDPDFSLATGQHVIFCKKNTHDLKKLNEKLHGIKSKVIIDDEADFATPNSKINKGEVTRINEAIGTLISRSGFYIGVTATPARLDLNNTFDNNNEEWVNFPPHDAYTGQDIFFPIESAPSRYKLTLLPDSHDDPRFLSQAVLRFLISVAHINLTRNGGEENFCMLVHTSGKKIDHKADKKPIDDIFNSLADVNGKNFPRTVSQLKSIAAKLYDPAHAARILDYIVLNRSRFRTVVMNSERDPNVDFKSATNPAALFTFAIGGNIVSRGVTFDNLLSMFFTRDSKHKLQQDTYIQRARMFGSRLDYLEHFELTIPQNLFADWHRCFVFHKLSLAAIRNGQGSPTWLGSTRISPVSAASVDRTNVSLDKGEMSFKKFRMSPSLWTAISQLNDPLVKLQKLRELIGDEAFPKYLFDYITHTAQSTDTIGIHEPASIMRYSDADKDKIARDKSLIGKTQTDKFKNAAHHIFIFYNDTGWARIFYKFTGSIQFIQNLKHVRRV